MDCINFAIWYNNNIRIKNGLHFWKTRREKGLLEFIFYWEMIMYPLFQSFRNLLPYERRYSLLTNAISDSLSNFSNVDAAHQDDKNIQQILLSHSQTSLLYKSLHKPVTARIKSKTELIWEKYFNLLTCRSLELDLDNNTQVIHATNTTQTLYLICSCLLITCSNNKYKY